VQYLEGPEQDVLTRFYWAAKAVGAKHVIRITSDCPLIDSSIISYMAWLVAANNFDFLTNLPCIDGQDVEIMSMRALEWANEKAKDDRSREHVTLYIKENVERFNKAGLSYCTYSSILLNQKYFPKMSVDTPEDLETVRRLYAENYLDT
jgi:spore coat polysaccharide biosynthesis protein SpsF (cytidylyltransferase family)